MAKIISLVNIKGVEFEFSFTLEGQDLYFFNQRGIEEKKSWIKSNIKDSIKFKSIVAENE